MNKRQGSSITLSSLKETNMGGDKRLKAYNFDSIRMRRVMAYCVDIVCIFILGLVASFVAVLLGIVTFGLLSPILAIGLALVPLAYHTVTIGSEWNATVGMRIFELEVRSTEGAQVDYTTAFIHSLVFYFSMAVTSSLILLVSLFNDRGRLLHDFLTNSQVVRVDAPKEDL